MVVVNDNIATGSTLSGSLTWTASVTGGTAIKIEFLIDNAVTWTELWAPYQYNGDPDGFLDTRTLVNGTHVLVTRVTDPAGKTFVNSSQVSVLNATSAPAPTSSPTPAPTAAPTSAPTPAPTAAPTSAPTPAPVGGMSFGTRPAHAPFVVDGGSSVTISNVTIDGGTRDNVSGIGITIRNVNGTITIRDVDLSDLIGGIYIYNSSGTLLIENVRSRNMGNGTIGAGHSNHIQLAESSFTGAIRNNQFLGGRTEDMVSTWHSGGRGAGQELVIENNRLQGLVTDTATARAWTSTSGTGIIVSDGAGSSKNGNIIVRRNTLLTPGQVGLQLIDGPNIQVYENTVYGEQRPGDNNPITSWEGNPRGTINDNRWWWTNLNGTHPDPWFHMSPSGMVGNIGVKDSTMAPTTLQAGL